MGDVDFLPILQALKDVGYLCHKYDINFTALGEWLEETGMIKAGTVFRFKRSGIRVRDLIAAGIAAHEKAAGQGQY